MELEQGPGSMASRGLDGKVAVVTGGGRGLGRALACGLAAAGARVAAVARTPDGLRETIDLIERSGCEASAHLADVADPASAGRVIAEVERTHGPPDVLVNNAGVMAPIGVDWSVDPGAWWRTLEVNVRGAFLCARAVLPGMIERGCGRIVNITSSAAYKRYPYYSAYGASKAALTHLTASLAAAARPHNVFVFAFAPGFLHTTMTEELADHAEVRRNLGDGFRRALDEGRCTPIERAVAGVLYLASGQADRLAGRHLDVTDDLPELVRRADEIDRDDLYTLTRRQLEPPDGAFARPRASAASTAEPPSSRNARPRRRPRHGAH